MKVSWKKLLTAASAALLCGALLTGCGGSGGSGGSDGSDGSGGGMLGSKSLGPDAPKEVVAQLKLGDKDVPLYEYKGAALPEKLQGFHSNLAVTKDAIYALAYEKSDNDYHLKKLVLKDGAVASVEDLGPVAKEGISSDGTNIYYLDKAKNGKIGCYDGNAASNFTLKGVSVVRAVFGEKDAYTSGDFASKVDIMSGAISKEGLKDAKVVLSKDEFGKLKNNKAADEENNSYLICADKDGFYITTLATHGGGSDQWTQPLHMYGPDGKKIRTFECNEGIPDSAQKRKISERQSIATKDYVVFYDRGFLRVFNKKDGKYVGDVELKINGKNIEPAGAAVDDENHIYFIDHKTDANIYRIDL